MLQLALGEPDRLHGDRCLPKAWLCSAQSGIGLLIDVLAQALPDILVVLPASATRRNPDARLCAGTPAAMRKASISKVPAPQKGSTSAAPSRANSGPASADQQRRRQILLDRRLMPGHPIAALVQRRTQFADRQRRASAF
ncbi:MAG: hypothetical protein U1F26_11435 [Lysobacterales bacterium]